MRIEEAPLKLKQGHVQLKTPVKATKDPVFKDYILPNGGHIEGKYVSINAGMIVGADPRLVKTQKWETTEYTQPLTDLTREKNKQKEIEQANKKLEVEYNAKLYAFMANTFPKFINSLPRNHQSTEEHKIKELLNAPANDKIVNLQNASDYIKNFKVEPLNEASMGQEQKKLIAAKLKPVLAKYGIKGTLSVRNKSTISLLISEGTIDFIGNSANVMANDVFGQPNQYSTVRNEVKNGFVQVNVRQIENHFSGKAKDALLEIAKVLNTDNYRKSDWTADWVQVGHYVGIEIGRFDKPYKCTGTPEKQNDKLKTILGDQTVKESNLTEDAKQLIQNPILKVFDQFGKQYLAQVLDASLNKMIQAAARRGVKVTVPQLIAEIKDKPNGTTSQALFKAMATVIKQVSAQIPTIVTTNVSSISESKEKWVIVDKVTGKFVSRSALSNPQKPFIDDVKSAMSFEAYFDALNIMDELKAKNPKLALIAQKI